MKSQKILAQLRIEKRRFSIDSVEKNMWFYAGNMMGWLSRIEEFGPLFVTAKTFILVSLDIKAWFREANPELDPILGAGLVQERIVYKNDSEALTRDTLN